MQSWSRRTFLLGGTGCLLAACSSGWVGTAPNSVPYSVGVNGEGNQVAIQQMDNVPGGGWVATVQSARGIGDATVAWWGHVAPHMLVFELELRGLEHFSLLWAEQAVHVSVNSVDQSLFESVQLRDGREVTIDQSSPYWMEVSAPTQAGTLAAQYRGYRITTPPAFQAAWPGVWSIAWVDFYR